MTRILPEGNAGNLVTLDRIRTIIRTPSPWMQAFVRALTPERLDASGQISRMWDVVRVLMRYTQDRPEMEEVRHPEYLLRQMVDQRFASGDCDDFVVFLGALLYLNGIPLRLVSVSHREDGEWDHLYLRAWDGQRWVALDATVGAFVPGDEILPAMVTSRVEVPI